MKVKLQSRKHAELFVRKLSRALGTPSLDYSLDPDNVLTVQLVRTQRKLAFDLFRSFRKQYGS